MFQKMNNGGPTPGPAQSANLPLLGRIAQQSSYSSYVESESDYPVATGTVNAPQEHGAYDAVADSPLVRIGIYPGMASYDDASPLVTADGAPVPATSSGTWGQLYAAGRMR